MAGPVTPEAVMAAALEVMEAPWVWGVSDCSASACDVFHRLHGVDPLAPLRGRYRSALGAARMQGRNWLCVCADLAARAGLVETEGRAGDLGLIRTEAGEFLAVGQGGGRWIAKSRRGLSRVTAEPVAAWGVDG